MTDEKLSLKSELKVLEGEATEKRDKLMEHFKIELRKLKEDHGRKVLLDILHEFPTLNGLRSYVEDLPNTAKDDAATIPTLPVGTFRNVNKK